MVRTGYFRVFTVLAAMAAAVVVAVLVASEAATADEASVLSQRPFAPNDVNLFTQSIYSNADAPVFATGPTLTEEQIKANLNAFLVDRFGNKTRAQKKKVKKALALFGNAQLKAKVSDARLRAAVVSLKGTMGEPAINELLNLDNLQSIEFGSFNNGADRPVAQSFTLNTGKLVIVVNDKYQYEDPVLLSSTVYHELLHSDANVGTEEEQVNAALQMLVHMQQTLISPSIASGETALSDFQNTFILARLNSGNEGSPELKVFTTDEGRNIFPGGTQFEDFASIISGPSFPTVGNSLLRTSLQRIAEKGSKAPKTPNFDQTTLNFIDDNQNVLSESQLLQIAEILDLQVPQG